MIKNKSILLQTEDFSEVQKLVKKQELTFVRWINGNSGHELCVNKDGKLVEIKFTYRDNNPLNRIYNIFLSKLKK